MTRYNPAITAQKTVAAGGVGAVGVIVEIVADKLLPGWFPGGSITTALYVLWAGFQNWRKNK